MGNVTWTKNYDLKVDNRHFRVFVSCQDGKTFHASCLWYEKGRLLKVQGQDSVFAFQLEQHIGSTEDEALGQIMTWIKSKFGTSYKLEQRQF